MSIIEHLHNNAIFAGLDQDDLVGIAALFQPVRFEENEVLFAEGSPAERLVIVTAGKLSLEKKIQLGRGSGQRQRLATTGYVAAGQAAGWSSLTPPHFYTTSAVALEPTQALTASGAQLRDYLKRNPAIGFQVMTAVAAIAGSRYQSAVNTLSYFLSIVSHELRAPLAAIENYLHVMLDGFAGPVGDKQRRMLERSVSRVTDLRALIGDIVDLARMRPEQIQADFEQLDPSEIGTESIEDVRLAAKEKDIQLKIDRPPEFFEIVGARRRLRQVFTNLLSNAIKFSPPGSTVTFRAYYTPETLVFEVEDEGIGIPPDEQVHIFEEFFRAGNVEDVSGLGLGLSIAHKIVEAHAGHISVHSPYSPTHSGARFVVTIPRHLQTVDMKRRGRAAGADQQADKKLN